MFKQLRSLFIAFVTLTVSFAQAQAPSVEPHISLNLQNATFPQICKAFIAKTDLNLLAELHLVHEPFANLDIQNKPVSSALCEIAEMFQREVIPVNHTTVLRSPRWAYRRLLDRQSVAQGYIPRPSEGKVEVKVQRSPAGVMRVDVEANGVSVGRLVQSLAKQTGWVVRVERELQECAGAGAMEGGVCFGGAGGVDGVAEQRSGGSDWSFRGGEASGRRAIRSAHA